MSGAERAEPCPHPSGFLGYRPSVNEEGWRCHACGARLGYRPDLDRAFTEGKVQMLLLLLHEGLQDDEGTQHLVYLSNSDMSLQVVGDVADRCHREEMYDQYSILRFIMDHRYQASHGPFWRGEAERWLEVHDAPPAGRVPW